MLDFMALKVEGRFLNYWTAYMSGWGRLSVMRLSYDAVTQWHYWFLPLLFAFFFILVLASGVLKGLIGDASNHNATPSGANRLVGLLAFGALTSVGYFILLPFISESSWVMLQHIFQIQANRLIHFGSYFALGVRARESSKLSN